MPADVRVVDRSCACTDWGRNGTFESPALSSPRLRPRLSSVMMIAAAVSSKKVPLPDALLKRSGQLYLSSATQAMG